MAKIKIKQPKLPTGLAKPRKSNIIDSTGYYGAKEYISKLKAMNAGNKPEMDRYFKESEKAKQDRYRQKLKGKPGYDKNGFLIKNK